MRLLADESCDLRVVRALRGAGHDVRAVIEVSPGLPDDEVLAIAVADDRIFITEDRDFGQLVFASRARSRGVIPIRFPTSARERLPATVVDFVAQRGNELQARFAVIEPGRVRVGSIRH